MRKRTLWGLLVLVLLGGVGALAAWQGWFAERKPEWGISFQTPPLATSPPPATVRSGVAVPEAGLMRYGPPPPAPFAAPEGGELAIEIRGKRFGRERYAFSALPEGGFEARAEGRFEFEVALVALEVNYRQLLRLDAQLDPVYFDSEIQGPLGFGNHQMRVEFGPEGATVVSGDETTSIPLTRQGVLLISMFASYALLPQRIAPGQGEAWFTALGVGGFGNRDAPEQGRQRLGPLKLEALTDASVKSGDTLRQVQRYRMRINGPQDGFEVLFERGRWVGLWGDAQDKDGGHFAVYRIDLFPDGFEVLGDEAGSR